MHNIIQYTYHTVHIPYSTYSTHTIQYIYHTVHTVHIPYYRWLTNCIYCNMHVAKVTVTRYRMHYAWRWPAVLETHLWQYVCGVYWALQYVHSTPWYIYIHYTTHYMAHPTAPCVLVQRWPEPAAGTRSARCERGQTHGHTAYPVPTSQAPVCVCACACVCVDVCACARACVCVCVCVMNSGKHVNTWTHCT